MDRAPTASFTTLGCKVNQYETQRILESFETAGFRIVPFDAPADVVVVNTCSVTADAERKSRYTVRRALRSSPDAKIVVTGCASQMALNRGEAFPDAHLVVENPAKLDTLVRFVEAFPDLRPAEPLSNPLPVPGRTRATLKVQDGCDVRCSYCSIPFTRPGLTSRPWQEVLSEAQRLADLGYREAVLTGVLIGAYGPETGSGGPDFEELIEILAEHAGLPRLRISSIEMRQVTPRLIGLLAAGKVAPHLHIPLQSGDDGVLADMNRPYRRADYLRLLREVRSAVPGVAITTDCLVGFPTETSERFESTAALFEEAGFLKAHVFSFSPRPGTPAERYGDPVPAEVKLVRRARLVEIASRTGGTYARRFLGRTMAVLFEGKARGGVLEGLTENYLTVRAAGSPSLARTIRAVRLEEWRDGVLLGEIVARHPGGEQFDLVTAR